MTKKKNEISFPLKQQLDHLKRTWIVHAAEAQRYKNLYDEADMFIHRATERLPQDHPLHPFNYQGLFSEEYLTSLADSFEEQDQQSSFDPELDQFVGVEEVPVIDVIEKDGEEFNISDYNKKVIEEAKIRNKKEEENETTTEAMVETPEIDLQPDSNDIGEESDISTST